MRIKLLTAVASLFTVCAGLPLNSRDDLSLRKDEPCKHVRDQVAKWLSENGIVPKNLTEIERYVIPTTPAAPITPSVAFACLKSVPLQKDSALQQLDFLSPLFEWQSTLDYLRDPPRGYLSEGVDLVGGLDDIAAKLKLEERGGYANEFEFLADLHTLTAVRVRDFHFSYSTLLFDLFTFVMSVRFVSISEDGLSLPKIYLYDDVKFVRNGYTASPVSTIDGIPALEFLEKASVNNGLSHDPDARFNSLFPSLANDANPVYGPPEPFALDLRDTTRVKCENGTTFEFANTAFVRGNFTNITSGADLYNSYGQGNGTAAQSIPWQTYLMDQKNYTTDYAGYPKPLKAEKSGRISGFLPEGPEFTDVAVLSVSSFMGSVGPDSLTTSPFDSMKDYYNVTIDFLRAAKAANRTKLILDVQGNSGGLIPNLATLYFALFPGTDFPLIWQGRAHRQLGWLGAHLWNASSPSSPWPLVDQIKPDHTPWSSFAEFYGPYRDLTNNSSHGAYTHPALFNMTAFTTGFLASFPNTTTTTTHNNNLSSLIPWTDPPFHPDNIILLTDGQCGSVCAIFTAMLTHAHGVRTVALGGRPRNLPMQAVGQSKGGPVMAFGQMPAFNRSEVPAGLRMPPPSAVRGTRRESYQSPLRVAGVDLLGWGAGVSFNVANMVPLGSGDDEEGKGDGGLPLQFRYEAANCRLFYTWEMARRIEAVWGAVVKVAWGGGRCVEGSTTEADGRVGGVPKFRKGVEDRYGLGKGPGSVVGR